MMSATDSRTATMIACRTPIITTPRIVTAAMTTSTRLLRASSRHSVGSMSFAAA